MEILLVIPHYREKAGGEDYKVLPIGLGYVLSALKNAGFKPDVLNLKFQSGLPYDVVFQHLGLKKYDVVATGNNALGYQITKSIIDAVKEHPSRPRMIIGGPIVTASPVAGFGVLQPDYAVIGEGEVTVAELMRTLESQDDISQVKGIAYLDQKGDVHLTEERKAIDDIDGISFPDYEDIEVERYLSDSYRNDATWFYGNANPRIYPVVGSRGCPASCTFCYNYGRYRVRSIHNIFNEISVFAKKLPINFVMFNDETLGYKKERIFELCASMKQLQRDLDQEITWFCQLIPRVVSSDLLKVMKGAGCFVVGYGFESYSPEVLRSMRKPTTPGQIDFAFQETRKANLLIAGNFIFGDIAETPQTAAVTLDYWKKNCCGQLYLDFVRPYPGSELYSYCLKKGIIRDELEFLRSGISKHFEDGSWLLNMTEKMSSKDLSKLYFEILRLKYKYRLHALISACRKTGDDLYDIEVVCPSCNKINRYDRIYIAHERKFPYLEAVCLNCHSVFYMMTSRLNYLFNWPKTKRFGQKAIRAIKHLNRLLINQVKY